MKSRFKALQELGTLLASAKDTTTAAPALNAAIEKAQQANGWFTPTAIGHAIKNWGNALQKDKLAQWQSNYNWNSPTQKTIGLVLAGNIPFVGLHDLICVWLSGHKAIIKCSSKDPFLLPALVTLLESFAPAEKGRLHFTTATLKDFDAVIATGSNNAARYFEHYFSGVLSIIRKNRNGVAVLTGDETETELEALGADMLHYFGLGCRNVAQLFLPEGYDLNNIFGGLFPYKDVIQVQKYANNYDYNKAVFLMSDIAFLENGFFMLREALSWSAPIATASYTYYNDLASVTKLLAENTDKVQCVVGKKTLENALPFGTAQQPQLWDYADGVDTLSFLLEL